MNLEKLISGCKKGDRKAQHALYTRYKDKLYALCLKYCRSKEEAQDHLQDSFVLIFNKVNTYKHRGSFEGWMKRIVINRAIDRYKSKVYTQEINEEQISGSETQAEPADTAIPLDELLRLVQELPDQYRLVFNLYQLDNYAHKEIAQKLGISVGTSKSNFHRAKLILKEKIVARATSLKKPASNGF